MREPQVAVVIPAFDAATTIAETLATASAQSLAAIEIVVVDDGSTDATAEMVRRAIAADRRIRLIRQVNRGPVSARNRAIAASTAPYVAPLDADDLWHPHCLARMVAAMERAADPPGFVYALRHVIDGRGRIVATPPTPHVGGHAFARHLLVNFVGTGSGALFRRSAIAAVGGYDAAAWAWGGAEDYLLQLRIAARWPIACVPRRLIGYRSSQASLSSDRRRMQAARLAAVRTALLEQGGPPLPLMRWVRADAGRSAAALLALDGRWREALGLAADAIMLDPVAAVRDARRRLVNGLQRRWMPPPATLRLFDGIADCLECAPHLDQPFARRMARLAAYERADATEDGPEISSPAHPPAANGDGARRDGTGSCASFVSTVGPG